MRCSLLYRTCFSLSSFKLTIRLPREIRGPVRRTDHSSSYEQIYVQVIFFFFKYDNHAIPYSKREIEETFRILSGCLNR